MVQPEKPDSNSLVQSVMNPALNNLVQSESKEELCSIVWYSLIVQRNQALIVRFSL
jgi:hypothetical protein